jgi:MFS family permease
MWNTRAPRPGTVALAGLLSLAAAMGIGRFAFTPLLPLMLREGSLPVAWAGWLAAANYLGYFLGALSAARLPLGPRALAAAALTLTALATAAMAWTAPALWLALRFLAGSASAWVFVATSVWGLGALARNGQAGLAGWVYAGVGAGIALTGLYCLAAAASGVSAAALWLHLGVLAAALALPVAWVLARLGAHDADLAPIAPQARGDARGAVGLVACYGLMGFGYILPATFLPEQARQLVDDPRWFGLAWPVFGAVAALSTLAAAPWFRRAGRLPAWAASQLLMGAGVLLPALWLNAFTLAACALLVGGTFMVITLAGVQEMRARAPADATRLVGRITAAFALGQIAGPLLPALLHQAGLGPRALPVSLELGAVGLLASGAWLWRRALSTSPSQETAHA